MIVMCCIKVFVLICVLRISTIRRCIRFQIMEHINILTMFVHGRILYVKIWMSLLSSILVMMELLITKCIFMRLRLVRNVPILSLLLSLSTRLQILQSNAPSIVLSSTLKLIIWPAFLAQLIAEDANLIWLAWNVLTTMWYTRLSL